MIALVDVGLTGVLGLAGDFVGVETPVTCLDDLPLRREPAVSAESRNLYNF